MSYPGDFRLVVCAADDQDDEWLRSDIDQTPLDGQHLSANGYHGVREVIAPSEWLQFLDNGIDHFIPHGRGRGLQ